MGQRNGEVEGDEQREELKREGPLTHTAGTALLWLGHRLGTVDRRAVEAVTTHMGTLKGTRKGGPDSKEPLPLTQTRPFPKPHSSYETLHLFPACDRTKTVNSICPVSPFPLLMCPTMEEGTVCTDLHRPCVPFLVFETCK